MFSLRFVLFAALAAISVVHAAEPVAADNVNAGLRLTGHQSRNGLSKSELRKFRKMYRMRKAAAGCKQGNSDQSPEAIDSPPAKTPPAAPVVEPSSVASPAVRIRTRTSSTRAPAATSSAPAVPAEPATPEPEPEAPKPEVETPSTSGLTAEQAAVLKAHNDYRAKHGANPLTWDAKLYAAAQAWTDRCVYEHGGGKSTGSGENIAMGYKSMVDAFNAWGPGEEADYNPAAPTYSHFTQVVWKATTKLGCGQTMCNGRAFTSCIYNPAGNVYGPGGSTSYFDDNVQK